MNQSQMYLQRFLEAEYNLSPEKANRVMKQSYESPSDFTELSFVNHRLQTSQYELSDVFIGLFKTFNETYQKHFQQYPNSSDGYISQEQLTRENEQKVRNQTGRHRLASSEILTTAQMNALQDRLYNQVTELERLLEDEERCPNWFKNAAFVLFASMKYHIDTDTRIGADVSNVMHELRSLVPYRNGVIDELDDGQDSYPLYLSKLGKRLTSIYGEDEDIPELLADYYQGSLTELVETVTQAKQAHEEHN